MATQLSLAVSLRDDATFSNFIIDQNSDVIVHALELLCSNKGEQNVVVWGESGCGLTHLLQACCHGAGGQGVSVQYLSLNEVAQYSPDDVFDGLESIDLVCLDNIEAICGNPNWEQGLFHFYNRQRDSGHRLLLASHISPASLTIQLNDLKSRILGSVVYQIQALSDEGKEVALKMRANVRGMELSDDVAKFILSRAPRSSMALFDLLNTLDEKSLQQKRKLTIPFVKDVLSV